MNIEHRHKPEGLSSLELALLSGADPRLSVDPLTRLNPYGVRPSPHDGEISLSSSTANTISRRGYAAAAAAFERFGRDEQLCCANEEIRRTLQALLDVGDTDIVLAPSGTDSAMQALTVAHWSLGRPITSVVLGADESGSGIRHAAAGRHFGTATSAGAAVVRGAPIAGLAAEFVSVALRDRDGNERPMTVIDAEVQDAVAAALKADRGVALYVMDHSKLGARGPSGTCIDRLRAEFPDSVLLVVDACQARLSPARIRSYLDRGAVVLITGSKFIGGPPLSSAMLVPAPITARIRSDCRVPPALASYTARSDWPPRWGAVREQLPRRANLGQVLRWFAALEEIRAYYAVPGQFRRRALAEFGAAFYRIIAGYPELCPLPAPAWVGVEEDEEFSVRTIFPFVAIHDGRPLSLEQAKLLHKTLNINMTGLTDPKIGPVICHVGQPVALGDGSAALRVSAGARLVSDGWTDRRGGESGEQLAVVFEKARALIPVLNHLRTG